MLVPLFSPELSSPFLRWHLLTVTRTTLCPAFCLRAVINLWPRGSIIDRELSDSRGAPNARSFPELTLCRDCAPSEGHLCADFHDAIRKKMHAQSALLPDKPTPLLRARLGSTLCVQRDARLSSFLFSVLSLFVLASRREKSCGEAHRCTPITLYALTIAITYGFQAFVSADVRLPPSTRN